MALTAPYFHDDVQNLLNMLVLFTAVVLGAVAFVHCLTQRADAFPAIGTLPKGGWLALLGITVLLSLVTTRMGMIIFPLICIGAAMVYLLDVRAGLRDLTDGKGFW
ncbi:MAG TPA: DUF2516 family protein [Pilimelia sp.]|nr:DUF2516 family protein [Pilimelia sp.]